MLLENGDRIVFAGDSVTDMGSANPVGEGLFESLGNGYVREIENLMTAWYPELNIRVTNSGISGNTSRDLAARFDRDVVDLKPDWVSICIGINDVWRQFDVPAISEAAVMPQEYESNMEEMILKIKDHVKGIFIISPYYIEAFCKIQHSSKLAWDRVHPNRMGAMLQAKEFVKHIDFDFNR